MKVFTLLICLCFGFAINAQQSIRYTFEGFYNGQNLNLQCRAALNKPWLECGCVDSIAINGKVVPDILYQGYQVDIANKAEPEMHTPITIDLYHQKNCDFRILNPNDFLPKDVLPVSTFELGANDSLKWTVSQVYPQLRMWVQIEQFRWNEWVKVGPNYNINGPSQYAASVKQHLFRGKNQFRVVVATIDHARVPSEVITIKSKRKKIKCKIKKGMITFSEPTYYEVYDEKGLIAARGTSEQVDIQKINAPKGKYLLRYANKTKSFVK